MRAITLRGKYHTGRMHGRRLFLAILLLLVQAVNAYALPYRVNPQSDVFRYFSVEDKRIALTFDDGPHPTDTDIILEILGANNARATFFVTGINVSYYPEIVRRIAADGHEIGNHTYSHADITSKTEQQIEEEIRLQAQQVMEACGEEPLCFRPPGGCCRNEVIRAAENAGMSIVLWSIDTRDWDHHTADEIVQEVLNTVRPGDIILFHDSISGGNSPTPEALRQILPSLIADGYQFVTVSELIGEIDRTNEK